MPIGRGVMSGRRECVWARLAERLVRSKPAPRKPSWVLDTAGKSILRGGRAYLDRRIYIRR